MTTVARDWGPPELNAAERITVPGGDSRCVPRIAATHSIAPKGVETASGMMAACSKGKLRGIGMSASIGATTYSAQPPS